MQLNVGVLLAQLLAQLGGIHQNCLITGTTHHLA
jgi:hypothetical protein